MNSPQPDSDQNADPQLDFKSLVVTGFACSLAGVLACLAWWLPASKPATDPFSANLFAWGRLSYPQFLIAIFFSALFVSVVWVSATDPEKRRQCSFRLISIWVGVAFATFIGETLAYFLPPKGNPFYTFNQGGMDSKTNADPRLPYVRIPNMKWEGLSQGDTPEWLPDPYARRLTFQTDSQGFRNSQELKKADIVFIGDSFTEGGNVAEEETFVRLTGNALNRSAKNLGLFGYSPQTEWVILEEYGFECDPQVVVWQFYEGNDISDAWNYLKWEFEWIQFGKPDQVPRWDFRHNTWSQRSPTYQIFQMFANRKRAWLEGSFHTNHKVSSVRFGYWPKPEDHYPLGHPESTLGPGSNPGWQSLVQYLTQGEKILYDRNIKLLILFIPMKMTAMGHLIEFDERSKRMIPPDLKSPSDLIIPKELSMGYQLGLVCEKLGVPYINTTEDLRNATNKGEMVYFPYDSHLSPRGHEVVSELLTNSLNKMLE